ncbi:ASCH domain-containing protein [Lactococcus lactis]|uniref:ASCH domain-containing protein n=1 Tax=Lactococcus lactis TaxID=1358 RepID=UPI00384CB3B2
MFGNSIDNITDPELGYELAELVRTGKKSATTSALIEYDMYNEPIPTVDGKFDIVLNSKCEPVAILTNSKVYQTIFDKVAERALKEGEGDLSLSY